MYCVFYVCILTSVVPHSVCAFGTYKLHVCIPYVPCILGVSICVTISLILWHIWILHKMCTLAIKLYHAWGLSVSRVFSVLRVLHYFGMYVYTDISRPFRGLRLVSEFWPRPVPLLQTCCTLCTSDNHSYPYIHGVCILSRFEAGHIATCHSAFRMRLSLARCPTL